MASRAKKKPTRKSKPKSKIVGREANVNIDDLLLDLDQALKAV